MIWLLNIDVAIVAIRNAFNPLTCTVELYDYQKVIRFRVFGPDNTAVLSIQSLSVRDVVDPSILRAELQQARALVETKGFRLKSWTLPKLANIHTARQSVDVTRPAHQGPIWSFPRQGVGICRY